MRLGLGDSVNSEGDNLTSKSKLDASSKGECLVSLNAKEERGSVPQGMRLAAVRAIHRQSCHPSHR